MRATCFDQHGTKPTSLACSRGSPLIKATLTALTRTCDDCLQLAGYVSNLQMPMVVQRLHRKPVLIRNVTILLANVRWRVLELKRQPTTYSVGLQDAVAAGPATVWLVDLTASLFALALLTGLMILLYHNFLFLRLAIRPALSGYRQGKDERLSPVCGVQALAPATRPGSFFYRKLTHL